MASNIVTALNTGNGAAKAAAANTPAVNATVNTAASRAADSPNDRAAEPAAWIADYCNAYGDRLLEITVAFLGVALVLGVVSSVLGIAKEWSKTEPSDRQLTRQIGDPTKFMDALKGLVEALAKAPAWFALFLGGALLLWMAGSFAGSVCTQRDAGLNTQTNTTQPRRPADDPARNSQAGANNTQPAGGNSQERKSGR